MLVVDRYAKIPLYDGQFDTRLIETIKISILARGDFLNTGNEELLIRESSNEKDEIANSNIVGGVSMVGLLLLTRSLEDGMLKVINTSYYGDTQVAKGIYCDVWLNWLINYKK